MAIEIPERLKNPDFRFVLLGNKNKIPFESKWQEKGYAFDDSKLLKHISLGKNYGVIGGFGNLRIRDIDDRELAKTLIEQNDFDTFAVKTGSGGLHIYYISDYAENKVLTNGELRCNNYQVVGASCTHPNGNKYEVISDKPIKHISSEQLEAEWITPFLKPETSLNLSNSKPEADESRSATEYRYICSALGKGKTREQIYREMDAFEKWKSSSEAYRTKTFEKAQSYVQLVNVNNNTTTPTLLTTPHYINSWGYFDKDKAIHIEQITPSLFFYNVQGKKGLTEIQKRMDDKGKKVLYRYIVINELIYIFKKDVYDARLFYNIPSVELIQQYLRGDYKPRSYKLISQDCSQAIKEMFDFTELDLKVSEVFIGQSWIKPLLNNFFFYMIDSTFGGGKTTLGEIIFYLARHGFCGGNISSASIPRLTQELDLNIYIDEIDQNSKDDDALAVLRKGQRRGNPYVRCEGRENIPIAYDISGCHGGSFRSELEDAFMNRALRVHTQKSSDYRLPVINSYKKEILKTLADELFIWHLESLVVTCSGEERRRAVSLTRRIFNRDELYNNFTKHLTSEEQKFLKEVFGRDNELSFLCLETSKVLGLDILEDLKAIILKKKSDESSSEGFYTDALREFIYRQFPTICNRTLKDGSDAGYPFYPKSRLYQTFIMHLKDMEVSAIGTKKFASLLRDFGFTEGMNIRSQRYEGLPTPCLIFNKETCDKLGLSFEPIKQIKLTTEEAIQ